MNSYHFKLIVNAEFSEALTDEDLTEASAALNLRGCNVTSVNAHSRGLEFSFDRKGSDLKQIISSAVEEVESIAGFDVELVEMSRDTQVLAS